MSFQIEDTSQDSWNEMSKQAKNIRNISVLTVLCCGLDGAWNEFWILIYLFLVFWRFSFIFSLNFEMESFWRRRRWWWRSRTNNEHSVWCVSLICNHNFNPLFISIIIKDFVLYCLKRWRQPYNRSEVG